MQMAPLGSEENEVSISNNIPGNIQVFDLKAEHERC